MRKIFFLEENALISTTKAQIFVFAIAACISFSDWVSNEMRKFCLNFDDCKLWLGVVDMPDSNT